MQMQEFNALVEQSLQLCRDVLIRKGDEYSTADKLHNFKQAASLQLVTQRQALGGMLAKHTISIFDMIRSGKEYSAELWDEKITDHINYLLLLRAIVAEEALKMTVSIGADNNR